MDKVGGPLFSGRFLVCRIKTLGLAKVGRLRWKYMKHVEESGARN